MHHSKTILCIDDDRDDRDFVRMAITRMAPELQVLEAANGREALELLEKAKMLSELPCLLILDINMPIMNGKQTLENIQKDNVLQSLPVVVFTSSENPNDKSYFAGKGTTVISKPFDYRMYQSLLQPYLRFCQ